MDWTAQFRKDAKLILTQGVGSVAITFTTPLGTMPVVTAICKGLAVKHSTTVDPRTGLTVVAKTVRVTVSKAALDEAGYTTAGVRASLQYHQVSFVDSTGITYNGVINSVYPDDTIGTILCEIGDKA